MKQLMKNSKYLYLILGVLALLGIFFPLLNVSVDFLGTSNAVEVSVVNLLQNVGSQQRQMAQAGGMMQENPMLPEIGRTIVRPFIAYVVMLIGLVVVTLFLFIQKFKIATNVLLASIIPLCVYVGFAFTSLSTTLSESLMEVFESPIFLSMIDLTDLLSVSLGNGFWLTVISIGMLVVVRVVTQVYPKIERLAHQK